jgi:hypothetical protein
MGGYRGPPRGLLIPVSTLRVAPHKGRECSERILDLDYRYLYILCSLFFFPSGALKVFGHCAGRESGIIFSFLYNIIAYLGILIKKGGLCMLGFNGLI